MKRHTLFTAAFVLNALLTLSCESHAQLMRNSWGPYELQVLVGGSPTQVYYHQGESFILGQMGEHYTLRIINHAGYRIEAVVTVDGLDVLDGRSGNLQKRGYIIQAYSSVDISGWRVSNQNVAAFRFSTVQDSYAGKTGRARNVGVVGVAIFPERRYIPPRPVYSPQTNNYQGTWGDAPTGGTFSRRSAPKAEESEKKSPSAGEKRDQAPASSMGSAAPVRKSKEAASSYNDESLRRRGGLATSFGESLYAPVTIVSFYRANPSRPVTFLGVRYNDYQGLSAMGVNLSGWDQGPDDTWLRQTARPFPAQRRYAAPPPGWDY